MLRFARNHSAHARTASGVNILLGIWLIVSTWVFDYRGRSAVSSNIILGALIALLAMSRLAWLRDNAGLSAVNLVLAFWTIYSPWAYEYAASGSALLNNVVVGILVAALAIRSATATDAEQRHRLETSAH